MQSGSSFAAASSRIISASLSDSSPSSSSRRASASGVKPAASIVAISQPLPLTKSASMSRPVMSRQVVLMDEFPPPCRTSAGSAPMRRL